MDDTFAILRATRENVLGFTAKLSPDELVCIPEGQGNHILWQLGHIWVTLEILAYKMSGLDLPTAGGVVDLFRKGTSPADWSASATPDIATVREGLAASSEQVISDYAAGVFHEYNRYETSYGYVLENIDGALQFSNTHEALHFGVIMAIKKRL